MKNQQDKKVLELCQEIITGFHNFGMNDERTGKTYLLLFFAPETCLPNIFIPTLEPKEEKDGC